MVEPPRHPRRRGEVDRQPLLVRADHDIAIPGTAVAPGIARQRKRGTAFRRRRLCLFQKLDPAREPRLIPILPLLDPAKVALAQIMIEQVVAEARSEEHTSELQSLMRISYAVFCLKNKTQITH